jgi:8-oxo-dGTP diphosphatase
MTYTYKYPKADNTVDAVVFGVEQGKLVVLLIRRGREKEPSYNSWALPGGFINMDETLEESVRRELKEETGLDLPYLKQIGTFGDPGRDPRGRVISTAYMALVPPTSVEGGDDASDARWHPVEDLPPLAFDHEKILATGREHLNSLAIGPDSPVGSLLPDEFTLTELQKVCEAILGPLDKRHFRARVLSAGLVESTGETRRGSHRPAELFRIKNGHD